MKLINLLLIFLIIGCDIRELGDDKDSPKKVVEYIQEQELSTEELETLKSLCFSLGRKNPNFQISKQVQINTYDCDGQVSSRNETIKSQGSRFVVFRGLRANPDIFYPFSQMIQRSTTSPINFAMLCNEVEAGNEIKKFAMASFDTITMLTISDDISDCYYSNKVQPTNAHCISYEMRQRSDKDENNYDILLDKNTVVVYPATVNPIGLVKYQLSMRGTCSKINNKEIIEEIYLRP